MTRYIDGDVCIEKIKSMPITYDAETVQRCIEVVSNAPTVDVSTVDTKPHWIPCSERLPEKSGKYYVSGGDKVWICEFLIIPNFTGGWCNDVSNPAVQAWMPLPDPYEVEK